MSSLVKCSPLTNHKELQSWIRQKNKQQNQLGHEKELHNHRVDRNGIEQPELQLFRALGKDAGNGKDAENVAHDNDWSESIV